MIRKKNGENNGLLSVLYLVSNEEKLLEKSIRSIYEIADEIVIIDTGSCDSTIQICRRFRKTKILTYPWVHDFSKSRNYGIKQCSMPWIFCIDSDEMLDDKSASSIRSAASNAKENVLGYAVHIRDYENEWGPLAKCNVSPFFESPQVRLFRRDPGIQFEGRVLESVKHSIQRKNGGIDLLKANIHHYLWKGRGFEYSLLKLRYYNKLGAHFDLVDDVGTQANEKVISIPKVGIVMACSNALQHTKECLTSIHENTNIPYELFVVDNGSTDGTADHVSGLIGKKVIRLDKNMGVSNARNIAVTEAIKDPLVKYVCFIDNDVKVSPDWLSKMVKVMDENKQIGILGPLSSSANGIQNVAIQYPGKDFATINNEVESRSPSFIPVDEIDRFCMLVRVGVLGSIGLFDDSFGLYGYEELDFCRRAKESKIEIAVANRTYIEHKGGTTINANGMDWRRIMMVSSTRFNNKWDSKPKAQIQKSIGSSDNLVTKQADSFLHPRTSIVILTCNRLDVTKECINSILRNTSSFELIVVDNGSSDGTPDWLASRDNVTVIRNDRNIGIPKARNQGIRASSCEYIVLMDNDIVVKKRWLEELFSTIEKGHDIVGVEAWKLGQNNQPIYKCLHTHDSFDYLGGACCLFKRKVFNEIGLLDEGFSPAYYEDVDISIRASKFGFKLGWHHCSNIHHKEHATLIHGQKDFNYQEQLSRSYVRFRDKMNGELIVEHEKLQPLNRKLKILYLGMLYDYGEPQRGQSFEHENFFPALSEWERTKELIHFDFVAHAREHGVPKMSRMLLDSVYENEPDVLFSVFFNNEHDPRKDVLSRISEKTPTKTIGWFCDSHWRYENFDKPWAHHLNFCVTTSTVAYQRYITDGFKDKVIKSQWAASPKYRKFEGTEKDIDVSFVGQPHGDRRAVIQAIRNAGIHVQVFGNGWGTGTRISFSEMVWNFNRTKINLNLNNSCDARIKQIKGRNFEVPSCGGFLLTEKAENLNEYYEYRKEVETYDNTEGLIHQIKYYLKHEGQREEIARAGLERTIKEHTYSHRFDNIFSRAGTL